MSKDKINETTLRISEILKENIVKTKDKDIFSVSEEGLKKAYLEAGNISPDTVALSLATHKQITNAAHLAFGEFCYDRKNKMFKKDPDNEQCLMLSLTGHEERLLMNGYGGINNIGVSNRNEDYLHISNYLQTKFEVEF